MEQTTAAEEQYWTLIVAGVPQLDESGQDEPLIDELVAGVKPILIIYLPQDPRVLYVVVKSLSAALDAQKWLYKRKRQGKYEIISGLVGTVGFATGLTGDFGKKMRYRSPELTDEMWQEIGLAEADLAHSPEPAATPKTTGGPALDPVFPLFPSSSSAPAGPAQSQVSVVRAGKNPIAREVQDENLERQIELKREEQASLETVMQQLYAGLGLSDTSDKRQILRAQNLQNEALVAMRDFLRERIGVTQPDREAAAANEPFDQASWNMCLSEDTAWTLFSRVTCSNCSTQVTDLSLSI